VRRLRLGLMMSFLSDLHKGYIKLKNETDRQTREHLFLKNLVSGFNYGLTLSPEGYFKPSPISSECGNV
jgi:hypothetical protein